MRPQHILVTTFACVLSMASASFISKVEVSDSRNIRMKRETAADSQFYKCFEELTLKTDALLVEVKSKSFLCVEAADNQKKSHSATFQEVQKVVADRMKVTQDSLEICSKKTDADKYFECIKSFEGETRAVLDYINIKSDQYSFELGKIEHKERDCLQNVIDENRSVSNFVDLRRCIIGSPDSTIWKPPAGQEDRVHKNLEKLLITYSTLRNCTKNVEDRTEFFECCNDAHNNLNLRDYFNEHQSEYFPKLKKIDDVENSCVAHFVAEYLTDTEISRIELKKCLKSGRADTSHIKQVNEELIQQLLELKKSVQDCRPGKNPEEIENCITPLLLGEDYGIHFIFKFYSILDEQIANINNKLGHNDICMLYLLQSLQFEGILRNEGSKRGYEECFHNLQ